MLVTDEKSPAQMLSLLFRSPSVALSARRFQSRALYPSLKAYENGKFAEAAELQVDGVQDRRGAFREFDEQTRQMMVENGITVGELKTKFPKFTKDEASKISCRTLIINGESSPKWLRRIGELLAKSIERSEYTRISGAAHFPHVQRPAEFNKVVKDFLSTSKS